MDGGKSYLGKWRKMSPGTSSQDTKALTALTKVTSRPDSDEAGAIAHFTTRFSELNVQGKN